MPLAPFTPSRAPNPNPRLHRPYLMTLALGLELGLLLVLVLVLVLALVPVLELALELALVLALEPTLVLVQVLGRRRTSVSRLFPATRMQRCNPIAAMRQPLTALTLLLRKTL